MRFVFTVTSESQSGREQLWTPGCSSPVSGILMLAAGNRFAQSGWAEARWFALAGGIAIQTALAIERRGVRLRQERDPVTGRSLVAQIAASALILLAGAGLVAVGYFSFRRDWWPIGMSIEVPVSAVGAAMALNRRAAAIRLAKGVQPRRGPAHPMGSAAQSAGASEEVPP